MPSDYRLSRPLAARMAGTLVLAVGVVAVICSLGAALLDWPEWLVVLALLLVAAGGALAAVLLLRRARVVRLDETGYVVRWVRGTGVARGRWKDVEDVVATDVGGERCVVLRRRDGSTTTIPVGILDRPAEAFVQDLQQHLNRGHGYRPLR
ncbi:hypothetical protein [Nocardioides mesophilus]|uniref:PH domain-containing protein n=1 Tax=Nocardioides mesophilus TaxID=433659 RepID=A0A7G9RG22_9ACTN|nr:hypothetical protein [Nocardioides mesophilus]QNN54547.1 hypothetical protein H9L09_09690 [Nocardioides mesophilus]